MADDEFGQDEQPQSEEQLASAEEDIRRVKIPRGKQVLGILDQRLGASRMRVKCLDKKTRICRIPGKLKRKLWVREGDVLLVEPWEFGGDDKGDIIFKYKQTQVAFLEKKGYLKKLEEAEEF
jgi:translation initiation factor 1A